MTWKTHHLHIHVEAPSHLSTDGPCKNDGLACGEGVGHIGVEALVSPLQLALIQGGITLIEQDVVDQIFMAFLD